MLHYYLLPSSSCANILLHRNCNGNLLDVFEQQPTFCLEAASLGLVFSLGLWLLCDTFSASSTSVPIRVLLINGNDEYQILPAILVSTINIFNHTVNFHESILDLREK